MRARGEEEKVTAFSCGEYTARKCRNTILGEEGVGGLVSSFSLQTSIFSSLPSVALAKEGEAGGKAFRCAGLMPVIYGGYTRGIGLCRL
jgi:hypothetical protein